MNNQHTQSFFTTAAQLQAVLESLDELHTAASDNTLDTLNERGGVELAAMLREIAYVAAEAAAEVEGHQQQSALRLVKGTAVGTKADRQSTGPGHPHGDDPDNTSGDLRLVTTQGTSNPFYVLKQAGG